MNEQQQQQTEKRWRDLQATIERNPSPEARAVTALRGVILEYGQCETMDQVKAVTKIANSQIVDLAQSIADPKATTRAAG